MAGARASWRFSPWIVASPFRYMEIKASAAISDAGIVAQYLEEG